VAGWEASPEMLAGESHYKSWIQSQLLRRQGRPDEALPHVRRARLETRGGARYPAKLCSTFELCRVLLSLGRVSECRPHLLEALSWRHSEISEHALALRVLAGDWYLAHARALAGLPALDAEFGFTRAGEEPLPRNLDAARRAAGKARRAYRRQRERALRLDARTRCRLRAWQLDSRLELVDRSEAAF
jgi:hypothetical protein